VRSRADVYAARIETLLDDVLDSKIAETLLKQLSA
jgi:hypothetical protein